MANGSTPKLVAYWDVDSCSELVDKDTVDKLSDVQTITVAYRISRNLKKMIVPFTLKAYGKNSHHARLTEGQRNGFEKASIQLFEIPNDEPNATGRKIMEDMITDALETKEPSFVMLLSGDDVFFNVFESFKKLGFTSLLVHPKNVTPKVNSDYTYYWEDIRDGNGFLSKTGEKNARPKLIEREVKPMQLGCPLENDRKPTAIFWNASSFPLPKTVKPAQANNIIQFQLENHPKAGNAKVGDWYYVYGLEKDMPDNDLKVSTIKYSTTSKEPEEKHLHWENMVLSDIMTFVVQNRPPCNILVITGDDKLTAITHILSRLLYTMLVWVPKPDPVGYELSKDKLLSLILAASAASGCDWEECSKNTSLQLTIIKTSGY